MENPKVLIINNPPDFGLAAGGAVEAVGRLAEETAEDSSASSWSRDWDVLEPGTKFIPPSSSARLRVGLPQRRRGPVPAPPLGRGPEEKSGGMLIIRSLIRS
jgi:hypothetical protein